MNERHYRTYTQEFKQEALELLKSSGKSASQLEQELGITPGLLMKWHKRYQVVTVEKKARLEVQVRCHCGWGWQGSEGGEKSAA